MLTCGVVACGETVYIANATESTITLTTIPASNYYAWYIAQRANKTRIVVSDSTFPYSSDVVVEHLMSPEFRLNNMWRNDLLAFWWWQRHRTGLMTSHERAHAVLQCYLFYINTNK